MKQQIVALRRIVLLVSTVFLFISLILVITIIRNNQYIADLTKQNIEYSKENKKIKKENQRLLKIKKNQNEKIVYLTFDDGPSKNTSKIVNILDNHDVKGTFFVVNSNFKKGYQDIVNSKHAIGMHTYTHDYDKIYANHNSFLKDLNLIHAKILKETKISSNIFRFAGGSSNSYISKADFKKVIADNKNKGFVYYDWNCDSSDAFKSNVSISTIIDNSTGCTSLRNINLLMHDGKGHENTVKALPSIINYYKNKGYLFKVIDQNATMVQHRR